MPNFARHCAFKRRAPALISSKSERLVELIPGALTT